MDIDEIKTKMKNNEYIYTLHAETERKSDDLTFYQIEESVINGEILEQYPDTGRGASCLIVGFSENIPIHTVCGWRGEKIAIITVYVLKSPKFKDPWTRGKK